MGMPIISNDLRSSCRALLLQAYMNGGGSYRDIVFHDILDNYDIVATIPIDDTYKFTVGVWVSLPQAGRGCDKFHCADVLGENSGYDNSAVFPQYLLYGVRILWKKDVPLYAALTGLIMSLDKNASFITNGSGGVYTYYAYYSLITEYVKGSAEYIGEIGYNVKRGTWLDGVLYAYPDSIILKSDITANLKIRSRRYSADSKTLTVSLERGGTVSEGCTIYSGSFPIIPYSDYYQNGVFTDLSVNELDKTADDVLTAVCSANSIPPCYTHKPAVWLEQD